MIKSIAQDIELIINDKVFNNLSAGKSGFPFSFDPAAAGFNLCPVCMSIPINRNDSTVCEKIS